MRRTSLKKILAALILLFSPLTMLAQKEAYAVYTENNTTLTFYYDTQRDTRPGTAYSLNNAGNIPRWVRDEKNVTTVVFDSSFGDANPNSTYMWFFEMSSLTSITGMKEYLNTSNVTNMNSMFFGCSSLTSLDVSGFNTEKVTNMNSMFLGCSSLTSLDVSNFNTTSVTDMKSMFDNCSSLSSVNLRSFNTENVTDMSSMFNACSNICSLDMSNFNTAKVTTMRQMFRGCSSLESLDISGFNTSNVTDMQLMFSGCSSLTSLDVSGFNTANVTGMSSMFNGCSSLTSLDVSGFNTANVTGMSLMFQGCSNLKSLDVSSFNTANVTDMNYMFQGCYVLKNIYCDKDWYRSSGLNSDGMFADCTNLKGGNGTAYDVSNTNDATYAHPDEEGNLGYFTPTPSAYAVLDETRLTFYYDSQRNTRPGTKYDLNSGTKIPDWYSSRENVTTVVFDASFKDARPTSTSFWFYGMSKLTFIADMEEYLNTSEVTYMGAMFYGCSKLTSLDVSGFNTENVTAMNNMFYGCSGLTSLDVSSLNTENVTNMTSMFQNCSSLTTIYCDKGWNKEGLTSTDMFNGCTKLVGGNGTVYNSSNITATYAHIDGGTDNPGYFTRIGGTYAALSTDGKTLTFYDDNQRSTRGKTYDLNSAYSPGWYNDGSRENVTTVVFDSSFGDARPTSTTSWFREMRKLDSIIGMKEYLNTSKVTYMGRMFEYCSKLANLDLSGFNTENVTSMNRMFMGCSSLKSLDVSGFNTAKVTTMKEMFDDCSSLTSLDVSSFNTANVTTMEDMFFDCSSLITIICDNNWYRSGITSADMFSGCTSLKGGNGTEFDDTHVDGTYAHPDAAGKPGYFTKFVLGDANGDGKVTITDAVAVVNSILGSTQGVFIKRAADVDGNGDISITDAVGIVNIILNSSSAGVKERRVREEIVTEREPD